MAPKVGKVRKMKPEFAVRSEKCLTGGVPMGKEEFSSRFHVPCTWAHHRIFLPVPVPFLAMVPKVMKRGPYAGFLLLGDEYETSP
jgi:hypothetical protein